MILQGSALKSPSHGSPSCQPNFDPPPLYRLHRILSFSSSLIIRPPLHHQVIETLEGRRDRSDLKSEIFNMVDCLGPIS
ncbi:hypothetical protein CRENBAI_006926 [Crenichthys baileyi]|uniref:Uncharacterized protein n=1 Tax=Crenichthys baileyi TaxID=28760 RepID=A0AAV9S5E3_9TELE